MFTIGLIKYGIDSSLELLNADEINLKDRADALKNMSNRLKFRSTL